MSVHVGPTLFTWAHLVATKAHHESKQFRRGQPVLPYIVHPLRVACLVAQYGGSEQAVAAALLHDVIEDTNTDCTDWPKDILSIVLAVTHVEGQTKLDSIMELVDAPLEAVLVKLADRYDNSTAEANGWDYFIREDVLISTRKLVSIAYSREVGIPLADALLAMLDEYDVTKK